MTRPIRLFYSYSHKDEQLLAELSAHLSMLRRQGMIEEWHDRRIGVGESWDHAINQELDRADVILLLVSADFLASDYCYGQEVKRALARHQRGDAVVIPVILRPVEWHDAPFATLQALPTDAKPVTSWRDREDAYTDITRGIRQVCDRLRAPTPHTPTAGFPEFDVVCADVREVPSDVLVVKYAQDRYGVDGMVADSLYAAGADLRKLRPLPGAHVLMRSGHAMVPQAVLFVGVLPLHQLGYGQIREFANYALRAASSEVSWAKTISLTLHGTGYGLDEREAFRALVAGLLEGVHDAMAPPLLERIVFVEWDEARADRLASMLAELGLEDAPARKSSDAGADPWPVPPDAGVDSSGKPHVFVAMPFVKDMEDVYLYGIQQPVQNAGYLCERIDKTVFTGDVVDRIRLRIETAALVIADMTGANPNVYLEVGYAWGKGKATLLISRDADSLLFDVKNHNCVIYESINDLEKRLCRDLEELLT